MAEDKLNIKQQRFLEEYIKCGNATDAYMKVYKPKNRACAGQGAYQLLKNIDKSEVKQRQLEKAGLTHERIFSKVMELMEAQKPISCNIYIKKDHPTSQADGEMAPANGCTKDFVDVPDNQTQLNAAKLAAQLSGALKDSDEEEQTVPVKLVFEVPKDWRPE